MHRRDRSAAFPQQDVVVAPARDQLARACREARRSGVLALPARNLTEFPPQAYHLEEHLEKDEKRWECVDLVKIDVSHNAIPSFSDEIGALTTLTSFKCCQNALKALPERFFDLTAMTYLDLSHNQLEGALSEGLGALVNLQELALTSNRLVQLPDSLARLTQLEILRIEENALRALPPQLGELRHLHTLIAHSNQLETLPPSMAALSRLAMLDLKKNRLTHVSTELATLSALQFLDLRQNRLQSCPKLPNSPALDQVFLGYNALQCIDADALLCVQDSLSVLELRDNKLSAVPPDLARLHRLKTLDLTNNDLADLPPGLGYLKHLQHLVVDGNPLRAIRRAVISAGCEALKKHLRTRGPPPSGVDVLDEEKDELQVQRELTRAKATGEHGAVKAAPTDDRTLALFREATSSGALDMSQRGLLTLPPEWHSLVIDWATTLLHLTLSKNDLQHLPRELAGLTALQSLTVEENQLETVDPAIVMLPHLQLLRLRHNHLTTEAADAMLSLVCESAQSSKVKELDLRNNRLTRAPCNLQGLTDLETLLLSFNQLQTLDGVSWQSLGKLSVVSVANNRLTALGCIYAAPRLASLSVENNNLSQIPCELALCPMLRALYVNGNPQKTVRGGVIAQGSLAILTFLKNKLPLDAALPAPVSAAPSTRPVSAAKSIQSKESTASSSALRMPHPVRRLAADPASASIGSSTNAKTSVDLSSSSSSNDAIAAIEAQLAEPSLSQARQFALKKQLALARASRLREERRLASQS